MGPDLVVDTGEGVELGLQLGNGAAAGCATRHGVQQAATSHRTLLTKPVGGLLPRRRTASASA
ncbi:MAG TPA: hypothetical protein VI094_04090 [Propionibacteriaceae bacterium]